MLLSKAERVFVRVDLTVHVSQSYQVITGVLILGRPNWVVILLRDPPPPLSSSKFARHMFNKRTPAGNPGRI